MRNITDCYRLSSQQCARQYRQRGVFCPRYLNVAVEPTAPLNFKFVQVLSARLLLPFVGSKRPNRQRVNLIAHQAAQSLVDELVAGKQAFAGKLRGNDESLKMRIVGAGDLDKRIVKARSYQPFNLGWIHNVCSQRRLRARSVPGIEGSSHCIAPIVYHSWSSSNDRSF